MWRHQIHQQGGYKHVDPKLVEILKIEEYARKLKEEIEDAMTRLNNHPRKTLEY